ncbi:hypothetical protein CLV56_0173 [Mumia flava]|uniref:Uncharacterized protein n=1 Tax=Mumia flava TaxID=1348852 RepID=A0A0B2BPY1_9ACTN|nr:hypothetical protein [Mumia flava]PJJ55970.1 hypothetical protein CLV56_0173 [Mumia flava]
MGRRRIGSVWPWVLALAVCAPLLASGYVLSYDMVFVPRLDVTRADVWGLGTAAPRAVPSDAVVAVASLVVPGWLLQKVILVAALGLAGAGALRLLERPFGLGAALAGATWFVWNPYVAERLVLGQWPLLVGYAGLPWLVSACLEVRAGRPTPWLRLVLALAATAMTPASGIIGVILAVSVAARRCWRPLVVAVVVNLPWIVAGLSRPSTGRSDPGGVEAFALRAEGMLGTLGTALSLGGVWNAQVVPTSRTLATAAIATALLVAVVTLGVVVAWRAGGASRHLVAALLPAAAVGLALSLVGTLAPDLLRWLVVEVPGAGLLRDGARYLALLAPLEAAGVAAGVGFVVRRVADGFAGRGVLVVAVLLPIAVMPDLAWGAAGTLRPVAYPAAYDEVAAAVADSDVEGDVLVLPFDAYRAPSWNHRHPVLDPSGRYFPRDTVVSDDLVVSGRVIAGEDPRARAVAGALASPDPSAALREEDIGLVVVDRDAPGADAADLTAFLEDLRPVVMTGVVDLYALPSAAAALDASAGSYDPGPGASGPGSDAFGEVLEGAGERALRLLR